MKRYHLYSLGVIALLQLSQANAGGFQLFEQSAAGVGNFRSGGAAYAHDASTAFYNAAGLTHIDHLQMTVSGTDIITRAKFRGDTVQSAMGTINQSGSADIGANAVVPAVQVAMPLNDKFYFGFDVSVPFGLSTDWDSDSIIRYAATDSSIEVLNFSASLGYRINDSLSIGGGPDLQRLEGVFNQITTVGGTNTLDSAAKNTVRGYGHGWHVGLLYDIDYKTRLGLSFRSEVSHNASGGSKFYGPLADAMPTATISSTANVKVNLPATTTLSFFHEINPQWDVMSTIYFTRWSSIKELKLENVANDTARPITVSNDVNYRNSYSIALGFNYRPTGKWLVTFGGGYDQTPTNNVDRDIRLPDNDRWALSVGGGYQATRNLRIDGGWTHLFIKDTGVDSTTTSSSQVSTVVGNVNGSADLIGLQFTWDIR